MTKTGTFNDKSHSFKRWERRITKDVHNGLVSIGSSYSSLYCSCCSALRSEYCRSTTSPWASRLIFSQRAPFRWVFLESMLGGVWGVLREKIASSKLMGLYPLWSPARCCSFIFNLVYRAYNQKGAKCCYHRALLLAVWAGVCG